MPPIINVFCRRRLSGLQAVGCIWIAAAASGRPIPASAQVPAVLNGGPPVHVVPYVTEPGVPAYALTPGTVNPFVGADGSPGGTPGSTDPGASLGLGGAGDPAGDGTGFVANSYSQLAGQSVGSGQCVALVQAADPAVGLTATWTQGSQVQGNTALAPGTVIATFNSAGRYANATDGSSHAAIYLGQNATGIQVMDQWSTQPASFRTIFWNNPSGTPANTGSDFYVVSH